MHEASQNASRTGYRNLKTASQCHYNDALTEGKYNTIQDGKDPGLRDNHVYGPDRA